MSKRLTNVRSASLEERLMHRGNMHNFAPSSEIFFAAVETTRVPMVITDPHANDNAILFVNKAFLNLTGYSAEEVVGRNCRFLQGRLTSQEALAEIRRAVQEQRELAVELINYRKNGLPFWNALFIAPVYDEKQHLIYYFGSLLDVSRRREAEESLRQAQKMEALGQLTGGIAHDFNNLLQVISGYQELSLQAVEHPDFSRARLTSHLRNAHEAALKASTLTQQLLTFARKQRLETRILNLNDRIRNMSEMIRRSLGDQTTLDITLDDTLWACRLDASQFEIALLNVILNARDAVEDSEERRVKVVTQNIKTHAKRGSGELCLPAGRYVSVSVTDSGKGIPEAMRSRILDPFFTTKEEGHGTGLGLSMVFGFVKQSGGYIEIDSQVTKGTTIRLYFPPADVSSSIPFLSVKPQADLRGNEKILIVEDRPLIEDIAATFLEGYGYHVFRAGSVDDALNTLREKGPIHLMLADIVLPGRLNGVELADETRRIYPEMRYLLMTGYARPEVMNDALRNFDVIEKPFRRKDLLEKIRHVLDR